MSISAFNLLNFASTERAERYMLFRLKKQLSHFTLRKSTSGVFPVNTGIILEQTSVLTVEFAI